MYDVFRINDVANICSSLISSVKMKKKHNISLYLKASDTRLGGCMDLCVWQKFTKTIVLFHSQYDH